MISLLFPIRSCYNDEEIERVLFYIKTLLNDKEANIKQSSIGVVSPYKRQYWKLEKEFVKNRWFDIQAGSVETFQGQEKPVIIVTTTKSQKCGLGFLQDAKVYRPVRSLIIHFFNWKLCFHF